MKICFEGINSQIEISAGESLSLIIENKTLFTRIVQSLISYDAEEALEPYCLFDLGEKIIAPKDNMKIIVNPFELPWDDKDFIGGIEGLLKSSIHERPEIEREIMLCEAKIRSQLLKVSLECCADYCFSNEWNVLKYLKCFGFRVSQNKTDKLLDNVIRFLSYVKDSSYKGILVFVNFRSFLTEEEVKEVIFNISFLNLAVLFIENFDNETVCETETKIVIDKDFLENKCCYQNSVPVSLQERICSNGFGAVEF